MLKEFLKSNVQPGFLEDFSDQAAAQVTGMSGNGDLLPISSTIDIVVRAVADELEANQVFEFLDQLARR